MHTVEELVTTVGSNDDCLDDIIEEYDDCSDAPDDFELVPDEDASATDSRKNKVMAPLQQTRSEKRLTGTRFWTVRLLSTSAPTLCGSMYQRARS